MLFSSLYCCGLFSSLDYYYLCSLFFLLDLVTLLFFSVNCSQPFFASPLISPSLQFSIYAFSNPSLCSHTHLYPLHLASTFSSIPYLSFFSKLFTLLTLHLLSHHIYHSLTHSFTHPHSLTRSLTHSHSLTHWLLVTGSTFRISRFSDLRRDVRQGEAVRAVRQASPRRVPKSQRVPPGEREVEVEKR